jgi:hypothetical protein
MGAKGSCCAGAPQNTHDNPGKGIKKDPKDKRTKSLSALEAGHMEMDSSYASDIKKSNLNSAMKGTDESMTTGDGAHIVSDTGGKASLSPSAGLKEIEEAQRKKA